MGAHRVSQANIKKFNMGISESKMPSSSKCQLASDF
jgi:hypothetical protein